MSDKLRMFVWSRNESYFPATMWIMVAVAYNVGAARAMIRSRSDELIRQGLSGDEMDERQAKHLDEEPTQIIDLPGAYVAELFD